MVIMVEFAVSRVRHNRHSSTLTQLYHEKRHYTVAENDYSSMLIDTNFKLVFLLMNMFENVQQISQVCTCQAWIRGQWSSR